ncbi:MAG TPA: homoserine dehydrogenase [Firmicutes bacterium]|jgi:homoserine dehydrogenase|nr:homoserine dehydrogenase [Bacillota bacterium]
MERVIKIGLLGLGTVGSGVLNILDINHDEVTSRAGARIEVKKILVRDPAKQRPVNVDPQLLTVDPWEIIRDPEIEVIIELIGGTEAAHSYVEEALKEKKYVITANKDLMALAGGELLALARGMGRNIYYEASVGGGIPLIRPLKHSLGANKITRLMGIINGTTNYILTRMSLDKADFAVALRGAQEKGFAEQDPANDLEGRDAAYKLCILAGLAFNCRVGFDSVYVEGIDGLNLRDIFYAGELGFTVKLLAIGEELESGIALRVHPTLISSSHPLAGVLDENNALYLVGNAVGEVMFYGPGAGSMPTGSSVVADLIEVIRNINHQVENGVMETSFVEKRVVPMEQLSSAFYLRLQALDQPGVFAGLANAFADEAVSLDRVIQKRSAEGKAEIVLITHVVAEKNFNHALEKIKALPAIKKINSLFRVIEG